MLIFSMFGFSVWFGGDASLAADSMSSLVWFGLVWGDTSLADSMSRTLLLGFTPSHSQRGLAKGTLLLRRESCDLRISEAPWWPDHHHLGSRFSSQPKLKIPKRSTKIDQSH